MPREAGTILPVGCRPTTTRASGETRSAGGKTLSDDGGAAGLSRCAGISLPYGTKEERTAS